MNLTQRQKNRAQDILSELDRMAVRSGTPLVKYAASKWLEATRTRALLAKKRLEIRRELRAINRRLKG